MNARTAVAILLLIALIVPEAAPASRAADPLQLVVCGWAEVFILAVGPGSESPAQRLWSWRAKGRADLPEEFQPLFNATDDCKPFDGGATILVTSSGGAVALVDRARDKVLFYGRAANAHSADLLPGGRIAVAASHDPAGTGDRLIVFDRDKPDVELLRYELPWGHGVVWDAQRRILWALADKDIRAFELRDWESASPALHRAAVIPLPEGGGHDFTAVTGTPLVALSTSRHAWIFDRDTRAIAPHPQLGGMAALKSISHHPTGRIAYVQAEGEHWWAERIHWLNPPGTLHVPGEHFYKARWIVADR